MKKTISIMILALFASFFNIALVAMEPTEPVRKSPRIARIQREESLKKVKEGTFNAAEKTEKMPHDRYDLASAVHLANFFDSVQQEYNQQEMAASESLAPSTENEDSSIEEMDVSQNLLPFYNADTEIGKVSPLQEGMDFIEQKELEPILDLFDNNNRDEEQFYDMSNAWDDENNGLPEISNSMVPMPMEIETMEPIQKINQDENRRFPEMEPIDRFGNNYESDSEKTIEMSQNEEQFYDMSSAWDDENSGLPEISNSLVPMHNPLLNEKDNKEYNEQVISGNITCVRVFKNFILTGSYLGDTAVRIWRIDEKGQKVVPMGKLPTGDQILDIATDGTICVAALKTSDDLCFIKIWNVEELLKENRVMPVCKELADGDLPVSQKTYTPLGCRLHITDSYIVAGLHSGEMYFLDKKNGCLIKYDKPYSHTISYMQHEGNVLITINTLGNIMQWDLASLSIIKKWDAPCTVMYPHEAMFKDGTVFLVKNERSYAYHLVDGYFEESSVIQYSNPVYPYNIFIDNCNNACLQIRGSENRYSVTVRTASAGAINNAYAAKPNTFIFLKDNKPYCVEADGTITAL